MRIIDAEALEKDFYDNYDKKGYRNGKSLIYAAWCLLKKLIDKAPTIEAKPVVHCKDCKYWCANYCTRPIKDRTNMFPMGENDFCSCGAQMDEFAGDINVGSKTEEVSE